MHILRPTGIRRTTTDIPLVKNRVGDDYRTFTSRVVDANSTEYSTIRQLAQQATPYIPMPKGGGFTAKEAKTTL